MHSVRNKSNNYDYSLILYFFVLIISVFLSHILINNDKNEVLIVYNNVVDVLLRNDEFLKVFKAGDTHNILYCNDKEMERLRALNIKAKSVPKEALYTTFQKLAIYCLFNNKIEKAQISEFFAKVGIISLMNKQIDEM